MLGTFPKDFSQVATFKGNKTRIIINVEYQKGDDTKRRLPENG